MEPLSHYFPVKLHRSPATRILGENTDIYRVVTKILSCRVNTTSRRGIKWLGIFFGSIFLPFSNKCSGGPLS